MTVYIIVVLNEAIISMIEWISKTNQCTLNSGLLDFLLISADEGQLECFFPLERKTKLQPKSVLVDA